MALSSVLVVAGVSCIGPPAASRHRSHTRPLQALKWFEQIGVPTSAIEIAQVVLVAFLNV